MTSRLICVNDIYSFDPNAKVNLDDFVDIIGRNFKQPKEGLGLDNTPSAHMWRTHDVADAVPVRWARLLSRSAAKRDPVANDLPAFAGRARGGAMKIVEDNPSG